MILRCSTSNRDCSLSSEGISSIHGAHHVAQKLTRIKWCSFFIKSNLILSSVRTRRFLIRGGSLWKEIFFISPFTKSKWNGKLSLVLVKEGFAKMKMLAYTRRRIANFILLSHFEKFDLEVIMAKKLKKKINSMWGGRFSIQTSTIMEQINSSIAIDHRLAEQDIKGSIAHVKMLAHQKIISDKISEKILRGLVTVRDEIRNGELEFEVRLEDIHMNIESRLHDLIGPDAGFIHTARSRNDQVATDFRMWVRDSIDSIIPKISSNMDNFLELAEKNRETIMPGFTHLQSAQPITFGHHMLAYVEMLSRDKERFFEARRRLNECPLGSAALAGTSFPIDRVMTAKDLGFEKPMANSIDAVSDRDFALDFVSAASICATHLSRFAEELVIWSSEQFGFVQISDSFSTGSSIMPQKRNPDAAELIRAKVAIISGALISLLTVLKGLPLAYSKDLQEDKEIVFRVNDNLCLVLDAMAEMLTEITVNKKVLRKSAEAKFITATDLADYLVSNYNYNFRQSHQIVGKLVRKAEDLDCDLNELNINIFKQIEPDIDESVFDVLNVDNSVKSRGSYGGTSPTEVAARIIEWRKRIK